VNIQRLCFLLWLFSFLGCGLVKTRDQTISQQQESHKQATKEQHIDGKTEPETGEPNSISGAGAKAGGHIPKVAVILGPGGVKSFAHAGVLKELIKAKIPISAVIGIEWGALVAGIFAQNGQVHEVEWKLYKLQKADLPGKGLFSSRFKAESIKVLNDYFHRNLKGNQVDRARVAFGCPSLSLWSGTLVWQDRGDMMGVISKCLPYPPLFKPSSPWMAAAFSVTDSVKYLKKKGFDVIILVNVLGSGELLAQDELLEEYQSALLWQEIRRSNIEARQYVTDIIDVETKDFKMYDFDNRTGLVNVGELAGARLARKIAEKYGF
jgi:NTE family protein